MDEEMIKRQYKVLTTPDLKRLLESWELGVKLMKEELNNRGEISPCDKFKKKK